MGGTDISIFPIGENIILNSIKIFLSKDLSEDMNVTTLTGPSQILLYAEISDTINAGGNAGGITMTNYSFCQWYYNLLLHIPQSLWVCLWQSHIDISPLSYPFTLLATEEISWTF